MLNLGDSRTVTVTARYADGTSRDVTRWCRFTSIDETVATIDERGVVAIIGRGEGAISAWFSSKIALARVVVPFATQIPPEVYSNAPRNNVIDDLVLEQLEKLHLKPSPSANDATFIRRAISTQSADCHPRKKLLCLWRIALLESMSDWPICFWPVLNLSITGRTSGRMYFF